MMIAVVFNRLRKEHLERILSREGCELRMNRSIQAEGSFGELKEDMGFRRFLCKGKQNVLAESVYPTNTTYICLYSIIFLTILLLNP